jgi:PAS domain S-box-containing protein
MKFSGHLVIEFRSEALIQEIVPPRIGDNFDVEVRDRDQLLYQADDHSPALLLDARIKAVEHFAMYNRRWTMTVVPRPQQLTKVGWMADLSLPLLGLLLSVGFSLLIYLLSHRLELHRQARDRALLEIAEHERTQRALRDSEARYRSVFDSAIDGLVVLDDKGQIVEANPAASAMHGYSAQQFMGMQYQDLIAPDYRFLYKELRRQLEEVGSACFDSVHLAKDHRVNVEVRGTSFRHGNQPRTLGILRDVTERKHAAERQRILSRKALMAQEEERRRLSRELHDELGQILTALHLEIDMLRNRAPSGLDFDKPNAMVERAANELRHICKGLRPPLLDDLGLEPAARQLVDEFAERTSLSIELMIELNEGEGPLAKETAISTYRILQESLNNIARHANAHRVNVAIIDQGDSLVLSIEDDGQGFDTSQSEASKGFGILGMRERALLVNGTFDLRSTSLEGTRITFCAPLPGRWAKKERPRERAR